jgi:chemotaxis signal transduction protein
VAKYANGLANGVVFFGKSELRLVSFQVAGTDYGVEVGEVVGIYNGLATIPTPDMPPYMDGEIVLNKQRVPVLSLRRFVGLADFAAPLVNRWIVVFEHASGPVGMTVDNVTEVFKLTADALTPVTVTTQDPVQDYVTTMAHAGEVDLMLPDFSRLIYDAMAEGK